MNSQTQIEGTSVRLWLKVKPRSSRERLAVSSSGEYQLELHAPATEGQANEACVQFLSRALRLPQASVVILSGLKSRRKLIRITGRSTEETIAQLAALAGQGRKIA